MAGHERERARIVTFDGTGPDERPGPLIASELRRVQPEARGKGEEEAADHEPRGRQPGCPEQSYRGAERRDDDR